MAPIALIDPADETRATLKSIIRSMPRSRIISSDEKYLHAEFRSRLFGFVDDVELLIDEEAGVIHFRAAARVGYSDLGVNRKRMERLSQVMRRRAQLKRPKPLRGR